jgi:hypothetical protein
MQVTTPLMCYLLISLFVVEFLYINKNVFMEFCDLLDTDFDPDFEMTD